MVLRTFLICSSTTTRAQFQDSIWIKGIAMPRSKVILKVAFPEPQMTSNYQLSQIPPRPTCTIGIWPMKLLSSISASAFAKWFRCTTKALQNYWAWRSTNTCCGQSLWRGRPISPPTASEDLMTMKFFQTDSRTCPSATLTFQWCSRCRTFLDSKMLPGMIDWWVAKRYSLGVIMMFWIFKQSGLEPTEEKHKSKIFAEPTLGVGVRQFARSQVNVNVKDLTGFPHIFQRFSNMVIPIFWAELVRRTR